MLESLRRDRRVAEARLKELKESLALFSQGRQHIAVDPPARDPATRSADKEKLLERCRLCTALYQ